MKVHMPPCSAVLALALFLPGHAFATPPVRCTNALLKGDYVFAATGFTRAPASQPGAPWVPKAFVEVIRFNGDGTLSTPMIVAANPFGDTGGVLQPPAGAPGMYQLDSNCRGTIRFFDASEVTFAVYVEPWNRTIHMIQTNPANNVFQGTATRAR